MHIACGEYLFNVGLVIVWSSFHIGALIQLYAESLGNIALTAEESCGDKAQLTRKYLLAACYLLWNSSAACLVLYEFQLYSLYCR